jgi:hypothetical protein
VNPAFKAVRLDDPTERVGHWQLRHLATGQLLSTAWSFTERDDAETLVATVSSWGLADLDRPALLTVPGLRERIERAAAELASYVPTTWPERSSASEPGTAPSPDEGADGPSKGSGGDSGGVPAQ